MQQKENMFGEMLSLCCVDSSAQWFSPLAKPLDQEAHEAVHITGDVPWRKTLCSPCKVTLQLCPVALPKFVADSAAGAPVIPLYPPAHQARL